jgi:glycosyltransferase involved in cell wall biosynthesis
VHIVFFGDQHLDSLGGAQVSMRLQRKFLERTGHTVTVVAPAMHGRRRRRVGAAGAVAAGDVDLPSVPVTLDREYSFTRPGTRTDRFVDAAMAARPPVDIVHVQAAFGGAFIGHRFARRHGLPVVHTMHNRVDVGIEAVSPFPKLTLRALNAWQRGALSPLPGGPVPRGPDGWAYLRGLAAGARAVTAPSGHFARRLQKHGVFPVVDVVWNGIDDDVLDEVLPAALVAREPGPPRFIWLGRMSPEKRLLPFLDAVADAGIAAEVEVLGGGAQLRAARRIVARRRPAASVVFGGRLSYPDTLRRIADADALVQTSIGFETQGMTPFEAASLGTPAVISDPDIGAELESGFWQVPDATPAALAAALRDAAADIAAGTPVAVNPEVREKFRQSSRTAAMLEIYERVAG